jgi:hypothetical protein
MYSYNYTNSDNDHVAQVEAITKENCIPIYQATTGIIGTSMTAFSHFFFYLLAVVGSY